MSNLPPGVSDRDIIPPDHTCAECGSEDLDGEATICEDCRWADLLMEPVVYVVFCPLVGGRRHVIEQREDTVSEFDLTQDGKWEHSRQTFECYELEAGLVEGRYWLKQHGKN